MPSRDGTYVCKSTLKRKYQFSDSWIKKLGEPDKLKQNPHYSCAAEMRLFEVGRVEQLIADNQEEYDKWIEYNEMGFNGLISHIRRERTNYEKLIQKLERMSRDEEGNMLARQVINKDWRPPTHSFRMSGAPASMTPILSDAMSYTDCGPHHSRSTSGLNGFAPMGYKQAL